jgi:hypothetical protein
MPGRFERIGGSGKSRAAADEPADGGAAAGGGRAAVVSTRAPAGVDAPRVPVTNQVLTEWPQSD